MFLELIKATDATINSIVSRANTGTYSIEGIDNNKTIRFCVDTSLINNCRSSDQYAIPTNIDNYYPCRQFSVDNTTKQLGYCKPTNLSSQTSQADINACKDKNKDHCTGNCTWTDVLDVMSEATSSTELAAKATSIDTDLININKKLWKIIVNLQVIQDLLVE
jgi:hypothetical protein